MAKDEHLLAVDIGATGIKLCEFEYGMDGAMSLCRFAYREYEDELSDATRMGVISGLLRQMLAEGGFQGKKALICVSGQLALMRFSHFPAGGYNRRDIRRLAEFESTNNIPFSLKEIIKDYQLLASSDETSIDMVSVVVKNDIVEQFSSAITEVGCVPILIDVAPAALYNAARANGLGAEGCDVVVNAGARVTNLVFLEGEKFFARIVPIGGYTITQQIAREFGIGAPEAEELKRQYGFVSLGGAYAEPESETAAKVSKIIRNIMLRLHGEITRTINAFVAQQHGSRPSRVFLCGGTGLCAYSDTFFSEKLGVPVEYFNPFRCVSLHPDVDKQKLAEIGHLFSECIGLGLRYASQCPLELSLVPANVRRQQAFDRKKLLFCASFIILALTVLFCWTGLLSRMKNVEQCEQKISRVYQEVSPVIREIEEAQQQTEGAKKKIEEIGAVMHEQNVWPAVLNEIFRLKPDYLWLTSIEPILGDAVAQQGKNENEGNMEEMPGAGMGFDSPDGMDGGQSTSKEMQKIGGLILTGCCIRPDDRGQPTWKFGKTPEFPFTLDERKDDEVGEGKKYKNFEEKMQADIKNAGSEAMAVYLAALRCSPLFSPAQDMTYLKHFQNVQNMTVFQMQVKFNFKAEYQK